MFQHRPNKSAKCMRDCWAILGAMSLRKVLMMKEAQDYFFNFQCGLEVPTLEIVDVKHSVYPAAAGTGVGYRLQQLN